MAAALSTAAQLALDETTPVFTPASRSTRTRAREPG
jgi:hypothetical protein